LALKFYASVRLDIRKVGQIKQGDVPIGTEVKVKVVKNKVAPPFRQAEFEMMHDHGISREGDLINLAIEDKVIDKSGAWLNYGDVRLGQGKEKAKEYLRENPALVEEITRKVLEKRGMLGVLTKVAVQAPAFEPEPTPVPEKTRARKQAAAHSADEE
jgi:recombination protein RecA